MIQEAIAALTEGHNLSREQARAALDEIMSGQVSPALVAGFLIALRMKGETVDEITGLAETMRDKAAHITPNRRPLVDTCGTGGDRSGSFNISTTAAFVVAGAGIAVAKHGNRSATSRCGSADVLEALGVNIEASPGTVTRCIDEVGIGFMFARSFHAAMKHVAPIRQELKVRTIFNIIGPLTNPANACGQVVGVPNPALTEPLALALANLGIRHAFVVSGMDGLDEITLEGPSRVAEAKGGKIELYDISPEHLGLRRATREEILGGDARLNAEILRGVLEGKEGPHRDIVLFNAAAAVQAGEGADSWESALEAGRKSIDSGAALAKLDELVKKSHDS